jgi:hypothetical protein
MLDPQEEARFDELKSMCRELKVPTPPEIMIGLQVHEGGVLTFDDVQRGHSWTRAYWNLLCYRYGVYKDSGNTWEAGSLGVRIYTSAVWNPSTIGYWSYYAIVIGTGDTAFSLLNYTLATKINSGNGSGELLQGSMSVGTPTYDAGTHIWSNTFSMVSNNNSGGSITVKETGLYGSAANILLERSVLSPTVAVANGAQLTVTYSISMDFSAID